MPVQRNRELFAMSAVIAPPQRERSPLPPRWLQIVDACTKAEAWLAVLPRKQPLQHTPLMVLAAEEHCQDADDAALVVDIEIEDCPPLCD